MHAPAENSLKVQRIKQNSLHSPTDSTNDAKFTPFIYPLCIMCQMPDRRQRTLGNSSKSSRIHSICPHHSRMMQNLYHLFTHYILCFRCLTIGREPLEIQANQAKFAPFTHKFRELREFHAFHTKFIHI